MDGVIVDLVGEFESIYGKPPRNDTWDMHNWWGIDYDTFWDHTKSEKFWVRLSGFNNWKHFYKTLQKYDKVVLCSSPISGFPRCLSGKQRWLHSRLGKDFEDYIFMQNKEELATIPGIVLVDDYDRNVEKFKKHGGRAILVPRSYNKNRNIEDSYLYVLNKLQTIR